MQEERPEGAAHTTPKILYQSPGSDPQEMSQTGPQAGSILQQVAQEASKPADQLAGFEIYGDENASQRLPLHSLTRSEQDLHCFPENDSSIITTMEAPTASLTAIADGTDPWRITSSGRVPIPELEEEQHNIVDNTEPWVDANVDGALFQGSPHNDSSSALEVEHKQIEAFAKLEFADGEFYMMTYVIEIGRDKDKARLAAELQARQGTAIKSRKQSGSAAGSITSSQRGHRITRNSASSVVSEDHSIKAADTYENVPTRKSGSRKSNSQSSSPQQMSRKSSVLFGNGKTNYTALAMASLGYHDWTFRDYPSNVTPDPGQVPLLPVYPQDLPYDAPNGGRGISKRHLRIAYNFDETVFEIKILGRNGCFVNDEYYAPGEVQTLTNGSTIWVGGVSIRFLLPDVGLGETGAETHLDSDSLSGGNMGFDMADSTEGGSEDDVEDEKRWRETINGEDEEEENEDEAEDEDVEEEEQEEEAEEPQVVHRRVKGKKKPEPEPLPKPKRKGPGRPPKNGIISKREQALLARQAREKAQVVAERDSGTPKDPSRVKASKDMKIVKKEQHAPQTNGKRKYTKRKRATGSDDQRAVRESTEQTDSVPPEQSIAAKLPPKPAKEKKPPKPPRSPSPVFDEATLTPEQLVKPSVNYIALIHEALSNSETGAMALPQIYRAMQRKYPYYKLRATTVGWQSSVRHNLGASPAFRKIERDGKGWMWGLVPGVSIEREKEKKRRATPPPVSQQPYYPPGPPPMQYPYSYPGMPPRTGYIPPNHYGMPPGMPPAQLPPGLHPRGPHGFPLPLVNAQSESTYQSPYQSTPPPQQSSALAHPPQGNSLSNGINGHHPNTTSQGPVQASDTKHQASGPVPSPLSVPPAAKFGALTGSLGKSTSDTDVEGAVQAIARYKSEYIDRMPDKAKAEVLVTSAINRTLGSSNPKAAADKAEDPHEKEIMNTIATMLSRLSEKDTETQRRGSDDAVRDLKPSPPALGSHGSASSLQAVALGAVKIEATSPLANGDACGRNGAVEREAAAEDQGGRKRPLENGDGSENGQPAAKKRMAMKL